MGSLLTSTGSLGFLGGSLGRHRIGWLGYVIIGLLGHNLDLVVRQLNLLPHDVMLGLRPLMCYLYLSHI